MRIRRHDALVNIIYNALSQDHPGVLKEQRASYDDGLRPGDVFILTSSMIVQLTSMSPYAAPLSLLLSPPAYQNLCKIFRISEWVTPVSYKITPSSKQGAITSA